MTWTYKRVTDSQPGCYVFERDGRELITQQILDHPRPGLLLTRQVELLEQLDDELAGDAPRWAHGADWQALGWASHTELVCSVVLAQDIARRQPEAIRQSLHDRWVADGRRLPWSRQEFEDWLEVLRVHIEDPADVDEIRRA